MSRSYEEADVSYVSVGAPCAALGIDIGNGVVLRYDEAAREIVGVTLIGMQAQLRRELSDQE